MFNFKQAAIAATSISPLMEGRNKISTADVKRDYKDGITIDGADIVHGSDRRTGEAKDFAVVTFKENPMAFLFCGTVLTNIVLEWGKAYEGDMVKCSEELREAGGVKVKLASGRTADGNDVTTVTIC